MAGGIEIKNKDEIELMREASLIVFEVLSEDSLRRDHGEKRQGYFALASVEHYLIADPERCVIIHHRRGQGDEITTRIVADGVLTLDPPSLTIALGDVFERPPLPSDDELS